MANATVQAERFAQALTEKLGAAHKAKFPTLPERTYKVYPGKVYDKIVEEEAGEIGGCAHAFVVRETGDLVKAASWSAPATSRTHPTGLAVRYNLSTEEGFQEAVANAGKYGYLYAR